MSTTTTTTTTAAERRADRRAARKRHAAELAALAAVRRMARNDDDVASVALLAAIERADVSERADAVAHAYRNARQARTDMARADVARMARESVALPTVDALTGAPVALLPVREHRSVRMARVALQHAGHAAPDCAALDALMEWSTTDHESERERAAAARDAMRHRCTESVTYVRGTGRLAHRVATEKRPRPVANSETVTVTVPCGLCAVVAALLADGPSERPDHDAATCARPACRTCAALRRRGVAHGPLTNGTKDGQRADGRYRAGRERTTSRAVELLRESDAAAMLDETRSMGAASPFDPSDPTARDAIAPRPVSVVAADLAIVATVGRRGSMVAWQEAALRYGVRADAWRADVVGHVAERVNLPTDAAAMRRHARAAGMSVADYATARTAAERATL